MALSRTSIVDDEGPPMSLRVQNASFRHDLVPLCDVDSHDVLERPFVVKGRQSIVTLPPSPSSYNTMASVDEKIRIASGFLKAAPPGWMQLASAETPVA